MIFLLLSIRNNLSKALINYYFISFLYIFILFLSFFNVYSKNNIYDIIEQFSICKCFLILYINFLNINSLPSKLNRSSDLFISLIHFLIILPLSIIFVFDISAKIEYYLFINIMFWLIILIRKINLFDSYKILILKLKTKSFTRLIFSILISGILFLVFTKGFNDFNLNPKLVHSFRESDNSSSIQIYIMSWLANVMIPLMACIFIKKKNYINLLFLLILLLYIFGVSFSKTLLILPMLAIAIATVFRNRDVNLVLIPIGLIFLNVLSILIYTYSFSSPDFAYLSSMILRRSIFVPSQIILSYYHFFDENGFIYWSNSILGNKFINYPFDLSVGELISQNYFSGNGLVNGSFLGTAFMHAGYFGNIIYAGIVGVVFNFIDYYSKYKKDNLLQLGVTLTPIFVLITSADLPTSFISHGLLFSLLLIPFIPENAKKEE